MLLVSAQKTIITHLGDASIARASE
jgi:hypothetical protein